MFNLFRKKSAPSVTQDAPPQGKRIILDGRAATVAGGRANGMIKVVFDDGQSAYLTTKEASPEATLLSLVETMTPAQLEEVRRDMPPGMLEKLLDEMKKQAK